jgi:hypothetical protein
MAVPESARLGRDGGFLAGVELVGAIVSFVADVVLVGAIIGFRTGVVLGRADVEW